MYSLAVLAKFVSSLQKHINEVEIRACAKEIAKGMRASLRGIRYVYTYMYKYTGPQSAHIESTLFKAEAYHGRVHAPPGLSSILVKAEAALDAEEETSEARAETAGQEVWGGVENQKACVAAFAMDGACVYMYIYRERF